MGCINTHCYFCGKKMNVKQREKFTDGYPYGAHDHCAKMNDAEQENDYYRQTLRALLGDEWRSYTLEDCRQMRMRKLGHEEATISRLVELCTHAFGGSARAELTVFGDGTCEVHLEHVAEVSDDGYDHQRTKILVALPQTTYPVTYTGLDEMLADLELAEWMDCETQTPQGARSELAAAERERDEARAECERLQKREEFLSTNPQRSSLKADLLGIPREELAERMIRLIAKQMRYEVYKQRAEAAEAKLELYKKLDLQIITPRIGMATDAYGISGEDAIDLCDAQLEIIRELMEGDPR